jgi:5-formyltetrahydrofolate cyclo-ligase
LDQLDKKTCRGELVAWLDGLTDEEYGRKSGAACERLVGLREFKGSDVIMMFLSLSREIETKVAISAALEQGKTVVVPMVNWHDHSLLPTKLSSLDVEMESDRYGLRHPVRGEHVRLEDINMIVVPGIGFDERGCRLGRGGGFYDRFLTADGSSWVTCGLAFEEQVSERVPIEEHDVGIEMLVTDGEVRRF